MSTGASIKAPTPVLGHQNKVVNTLIRLVNDKHKPPEAPLLIQFIHHYFFNISEEELENIDINDLYAITMHQWSFLSCRKKGEVKIRIVNPSTDKEGWQSTHTVIEVIADDITSWHCNAAFWLWQSS